MGTACAPQRDRVCVPEAFCGGTSCGKFDTTCLTTLVMSDAIPRIDCDVPTLPNVLDLCPSHSGTINLDTQFLGGQCDRQPLISSLSLEGFDTTAELGGATMELRAVSRAA